MSAAINFSRKLDLIKEHWTPKVIAQMNDYQFKLVKVQGDFVWHSHADTDETFIVLEGELRIDLRDGAVTLGPGEMAVVPRGVEHKPHAEREACVLLIEPCGCATPAMAAGTGSGPRRTTCGSRGDGVPVGSRAGARSSGAGRDGGGCVRALSCQQ